MHYQFGGTSFVKSKVTSQKSMLLEKDLSMIETKRKEFLNYWQEQKQKLQQVKVENARRLSDFNGTILPQNTFPPICDRQEEEEEEEAEEAIPELKPSDWHHNRRRSLSKGNIQNQALSSRTKGEENKEECVDCSGRGVSRLSFRRYSLMADSERRKEISKCSNCGTSEQRQSKIPLTKYQLKEIYVPIDESKDLQRDRQKLNKMQKMKSHLHQKKQSLDKKILSWCNNTK